MNVNRKNPLIRNVIRFGVCLGLVAIAGGGSGCASLMWTNGLDDDEASFRYDLSDRQMTWNGENFIKSLQNNVFHYGWDAYEHLNP